jgi:hypothetical protein
MTKLHLSAIIFFLPLLAGCDTIPPLFGSWDGWVYPDRTNLTRSIYVGRHKTLDACRIAAAQTIALRSHPRRADYECGFNCKFDKNLDIHICSRTER